MRTDEKVFTDRLRTLARLDDPSAVRETLEGAFPEDVAEAFLRLEPEECLALMRQMDEEMAADVLIELPTETTRELVRELPDALVARYLDVLPMDDAIELREELDPERFEALLHVIPKEDAQEIRRLLAYPEDSAGQLMTEDYVSVSPEMTMSEVLAIIRETPDEEFETVNDIYVETEDGHLLGVFSLKTAIRSAPVTTARQAMKEDVITVGPETEAEEVARQIARYGFYAMPVVDERGRMLGIVTVDDAQYILQEAETEDVLMMGGVTGDAEAYLSLRPIQLFRRRIPWLLALFVAETFTGNVMRHYGQGDSGIQLNPLTFFIPLLIGAGGNSGSQVTTTITRALALGEVRTSDVFVIFRREFVVACLIGGTLGLLGFLRALLPGPFGWNTGLDLSLVVGLSLPAIVLWSTAVAGGLPLAAKRLGADPAVMSAPFITTFVDATGLIIYFEIARAMMR